MKKSIGLFCLILVMSCDKTQEKSIEKPLESPSTKHETFSHTEGDTTYVMQKYFLVFLKKGPHRDQNEAETATIQEAHLAHLNRLNEMGKISLAGPSENHESISGFVVYNTETLEEADSLAKIDPAVKAGRLEVETVPWWAAKGSKLK